MILSPSLLSADFANLQRDVEKLIQCKMNIYILIVMDGNFVPNITIGVPVVAALRKICDLVLDVHLMINQPEKYIDDLPKRVLI